MGTPLYAAASTSPVSGLRPTATATVSSRFDPVGVTVWLQLSVVPLATDAPAALGPTASTVTPNAGAVTVNGTALLVRPPTVTTTFPVVAPVGTGTVMLVALQAVGVASVPLNAIVLVPFVAPKLAPAIVTGVPAGPDVGVKLVMLGAGVVSVKGTPLLARPPTVTTTFPVVAPVGTGTVRLVALQLVGVASVPLNATVLVPGVAPKFAPAIVTAVPTGPDVGVKLVMLGAGVVSVKGTPLLARPPTVTTTFPVVAPVGTGTVRLVALQLVGVANVPLNATVLVPGVAPKFAPAIVTAVPTGPDVGLSVMIDGGTVTVKGTPLLARPPTVTTTFPVVAPVGTGTVRLVALQLVGVANVPLNATVLVPGVAPKSAPVIVTAVPTGPDVGVSVMIDGGTVTVKGTLLLASPPTVTTTVPVVAPVGTGTVRLVALQLVGVATVPLNATVLVPGVAPKFAPAIVTAVPTGPDVGLSVVIDGGTVTVKGTPLLARPLTVTTTFPVVAPVGTGTAMLVALQLVGVASVPLNAIVLVPGVAPKFAPAIVTVVPTGPDVGLSVMIN